MKDSLQEVYERVLEEEGGTHICDPKKIDIMNTALEALKKSVGGTALKFSCETNSSFVSVGSISIIGRSIKIIYPDLFALVLQMAENMEVLPKTDGTVWMAFTFYNITKKIGG